MVKKILYGMFCAVFGFVVFYICWRGAGSKAVVNRSNEALKTGDYTFFLKFVDYAKKDYDYSKTYEKDKHTTDLRIYEFFSNNVAIDEEGKEIASRSGYMIIFSNINLDEVMIDEFEPGSKSYDPEKSSKVYLTGDNDKTWPISISTYGMDETNVYILTLSTDNIKAQLGGATKLTGIKIVDPSEDKVTFFNDQTLSIDLTERNDESYWKNLYDTGEAEIAFTAKEYRDNVSFAFPEMTSSFWITGFTLLALAGIGVFIFWPKKSRVLDDDELKDRFTFSPDEDKEKSAIERIAREKKEKDDRLNKYKNVRANADNEVVKADEVIETTVEDTINSENEASNSNVDE